MRNRLIFLFLVLFSYLTSCKTDQYSNEYKKLKNLLKELGYSKKQMVSFYLIIPLEGCSSSINYSIKFAKEHLGIDDYLFIITHYDSKLIRNYFNRSELSHENLLADTRSYASSLGLNIGSPVLIQFKMGKLNLY